MNVANNKQQSKRENIMIMHALISSNLKTTIPYCALYRRDKVNIAIDSSVLVSVSHYHCVAQWEE